MRSWGRISTVVAAAVVPLALSTGMAEAATTVALWKMDTLPLIDSTGHVSNGTTKNITVTGGAYRFNGTSSVASAPDTGNWLDPGTSTIKVTARVRFSEPPKSVGDFDLVRKGTAGISGGEWKMEIFPPSGDKSRSTPFCLFQDANGKTASVRGTQDLDDGAWHTISCTKNSSGISVTADGATKSVSVRLGSISNSKPATIGANPGGGDWFKGDMDQLSVAIG